MSVSWCGGADVPEHWCARDPALSGFMSAGVVGGAQLRSTSKGPAAPGPENICTRENVDTSALQS